MRPYWSALTWPELKEAAEQGAVVVVPVGSTEQHGQHLPVGADAWLAFDVARKACEAVQEKMIALYTPAVWSGYSPHHMAFPGTITLGTETFLRVLIDICRSIWEHGFRHILLLNAHGGNNSLLASVVWQLRYEHGIGVAHTNLLPLIADYIAQWRQSELGGINHSCEAETSLMLHLYGDLVRNERIEKEIYAPKSKYLSGDFAIPGRVNVAVPVDELSKSGVVGDPTLATADRGRELLEILVGSVAELLLEFQSWDLERPGII